MDVHELRPGLWRWTSEHPEWDHAEHWGPVLPVRRVGYPEDIATAVAFFGSEEASFVSGQVLTGIEKGAQNSIALTSVFKAHSLQVLVQDALGFVARVS